MWPMMSYVWTFCSSWIGGHICNVSPQSVQPFQRFLKVKKNQKQYSCWITWWMTSSVLFLWTNLSQDDPQKFSFRSDVMPYICKYEVTTKAPMTSFKKITLISHEAYLLCAKIQFFPWYGFRDRDPKFFCFSNMAATPRDRWCCTRH